MLLRKCFSSHGGKQKMMKFIQLSGHDFYKISRFFPLLAALFLLFPSSHHQKANCFLSSLTATERCFYCSSFKMKNTSRRYFDAAFASFLIFLDSKNSKTIENITNLKRQAKTRNKLWMLNEALWRRIVCT